MNGTSSSSNTANSKQPRKELLQQRRTGAPKASSPGTNPKSTNNNTTTNKTCANKTINAINTMLVSNVRHADVINGRGAGPNDHPGNVIYRSFIKDRMDEYVNATVRGMKTKIACSIISFVHDRGGRFLRKLEDDELLAVVDSGAKNGGDGADAHAEDADVGSVRMDDRDRIMRAVAFATSSRQRQRQVGTRKLAKTAAGRGGSNSKHNHDDYSHNDDDDEEERRENTVYVVISQQHTLVQKTKQCIRHMIRGGNNNSSNNNSRNKVAKNATTANMITTSNYHAPAHSNTHKRSGPVGIGENDDGNHGNNDPGDDWHEHKTKRRRVASCAADTEYDHDLLTGQGGAVASASAPASPSRSPISSSRPPCGEAIMVGRNEHHPDDTNDEEASGSGGGPPNLSSVGASSRSPTTTNATAAFKGDPQVGGKDARERGISQPQQQQRLAALASFSLPFSSLGTTSSSPSLSPQAQLLSEATLRSLPASVLIQYLRSRGPHRPNQQQEQDLPSKSGLGLVTSGGMRGARSTGDTTAAAAVLPSPSSRGSLSASASASASASDSASLPSPVTTTGSTSLPPPPSLLSYYGHHSSASLRSSLLCSENQSLANLLLQQQLQASQQQQQLQQQRQRQLRQGQQLLQQQKLSQEAAAMASTRRAMVFPAPEDDGHNQDRYSHLQRQRQPGYSQHRSGSRSASASSVAIRDRDILMRLLRGKNGHDENGGENGPSISSSTLASSSSLSEAAAAAASTLASAPTPAARPASLSSMMPPLLSPSNPRRLLPHTSWGSYSHSHPQSQTQTQSQLQARLSLLDASRMDLLLHSDLGHDHVNNATMLAESMTRKRLQLELQMQQQQQRERERRHKVLVGLLAAERIVQEDPGSFAS